MVIRLKIRTESSLWNVLSSGTERYPTGIQKVIERSVTNGLGYNFRSYKYESFDIEKIGSYLRDTPEFLELKLLDLEIRSKPKNSKERDNLYRKIEGKIERFCKKFNYTH